jgi:serine/threonine-protein kinase
MATGSNRDSEGPALYLLGGIALQGVPPDQSERLTTQSKVVALLAYLALAAPGTYTRRDRIVGLLWPELDQAHARTALRKAVHHARSVLGEDVLSSRGDEEVALAPDSLWSDVAAMRTAVERGQLARAVELYRGDLMPGFYLTDCHDFDAWLESERSALLEEAVAAAWALAKHLESGSNYTDASRLAKKAARLDRTNERALRRSLKMLDRLGDRAGALSLFDEFARRLRKELDVDPSVETLKMADDLRSGRPLS